MNFGLRRFSTSIIAGGVLAGLLLSSMAVSVRAECPFCSAVSQTLRQEMDQTEVVAVAKIVPGSETESDAEFEVQNLLSGANFAREGQRFRVNYFGKAKDEQLFLLMGIDPPDLLWSSPLPLTAEAIEYISAISSLPKEPIERLKFYLKHLEHPDNIISRDAYDEFASAPYADIIALKEHIDRPQLLQWIQKTDITAERRRLYLVMLGVVGKPEDAEMLEEMLRSDDPNRRTGLDALIACYATLKGEKGLDLIDELFLENKQSQYADTYSAIMALRFHGTEGGVIDRERVQKSMRLLLDRPELADLVIPDLARWEDWSQIDKVVELFKGADEKTSWVRVPVINYLRACPLPAAEEHLAALKEIDPAAYKRAVSFFPVPKPTPSSTDRSSILPRAGSLRQLVAKDLTGNRLTTATQLAFGGNLSSLGGPAGGSTPKAAAGAGVSVNRSTVVGVLGMVSITCWIAMWLSISGAGEPGLVARWLIQADASKS